tara:strand:- start:1833 stop:2663 length:831 start_codon:yes stop_codon:yes gene_type:complete
MNNPTKLDLVSGEIVMVSSLETERQTLIDVCTANGIKFTWQEMTPNNALRLVLKEQCRGQLVRKSKKGFVVVNEQLDDDGNEYETQQQFYCRVDDDGDWSVGVSQQQAASSYNLLAIQCRVKEFKTKVMAGVVSNHFGKLLMQEFDAIRMRPNGGAFFVPKEQLERWTKFANDYVEATGNTVHRIQSGCDANTASAVMETAAADLDQRYRDALDELAAANETTGKRRESKRKRLMAELDGIKATAENVSAAFGVASEIADKIQKRINVEKAMALMD